MTSELLRSGQVHTSSLSPQVTISLALTIVTLLGICWTILHLVPSLHYNHQDYGVHEFYDDNVTETPSPWSAYYQVSVRPAGSSGRVGPDVLPGIRPWACP